MTNVAHPCDRAVCGGSPAAGGGREGAEDGGKVVVLCPGKGLLEILEEQEGIRGRLGWEPVPGGHLLDSLVRLGVALALCRRPATEDRRRGVSGDTEAHGGSPRRQKQKLPGLAL